MIKNRIRNKGSISAKKIEEAYRQDFKIPPASQLQKVVFKIFGLKAGNPLSLPFLFADDYYQKASPNTILQILRETKAKFGYWVYENEFADCDDATFWLMGVFHQDRRTVGMPIFITWVGTKEDGHAVLSYYYNETVEIIEPQNYTVFDVPKDWKLWVLMG